MDAITHGSPRLSRAKALIGALAVTLALAFAAQTAAPDPASAQLSQCARIHLNIAETFHHIGYRSISREWLDKGSRDC